MNFNLVILIFICLFMTIVEYLITKRIFTPTSIIAWPYVFVIFLNNTFGKKLGFYSIDSATILQITFGILFFSFGSLVANIVKLIKNKKYNNTNIQVQYDIKKISLYVMMIGIITTIRLIYYILKYGLRYFISNDGMNAILMTGILCHFLLSVYPLLPILVSYSIKSKKKKYLIPVLLIIILVYFTFVKYHIISLILIILIFINIENPKMFKKTVPILVILPISIFFINYISNFTAKGITAENGYLMKHLINYLCGGLIYNSINPNFTYNNYGIISLIIMILMAVPNLFLNSLFNFKLYTFNQLPFYPMGNNGEKGNVLNTISFLFSSGNMFGSVITIFVWGFLIGILDIKSKKLYPLISVIYAFTFLSFYATFYVLTPPWEMIIFSFIMPKIFIKKQI